MSNKKVAIIMGSQSDWPVMQHATTVLTALNIEFDTSVISAHRTPERLYEFAKNASNDYAVIIAGAGGAAHLPGMTAAMTWLPIIAVPVTSRALNGVDSLLSIVQMPKGIAVATQAIGDPGAFNAGLMAAQILATSNTDLQERLIEWRKQQTLSVPNEVK